MGDKWLKQLLMVPARLDITARSIAEQARHANRPTLGDASVRDSCCTLRPAEFPIGQLIKKLPELRVLLVPVSTTDLGFTTWYACRTCGQEWIETVVQVGKVEDIQVRKAA
jgi:hypothetical protein